MSREPTQGFTTRAMHSDAALGAAKPVSVPIYQTSTFSFADAASMNELIEGGKDAGYIYTRWHNPTRAAFEQVVASLEGAEQAVSFASGMAAISTALLALTAPGDHVVSSPDLYGGTFSLMRSVVPRAGCEVRIAASHRYEDVSALFEDETRLCYVETIGNPRITVPDLDALAAECERRDITLVVDNTFASPYLCRPLEHGAAVVIHSATKYLGYHHDLTAGVVAGDAERMRRVRELSVDLGGTAAPFDAWLALRGIQTLALRMDRQCATAGALAAELERHTQVTRVWYPGLESHPDREVAARTLTAPGAMLSFELAGGLEAGRRFLERLKVALLAASLGGVHTLAVHPATVTHTQLSAEQRRGAGITDGLVRISVGIEDASDLISDVLNAIG